MAQLNQLVCPGQNGNVAVPECLHTPGYIIGAILVRKGRSFTPEELANLRQTILTRSRADLRRDRIFVLGRFVSMEDKSTEASTEKFDYGDEVEGDDGRYKFNFRHTLGHCYHKNLLAFNNGQAAYDVLFIDNAYVIMGTQRVSEDGKFVLGGFSITQIKVPNFKLGGAGKAAFYGINFALADANQLNKFYSFVPADFDPIEAAKPLADITLTDVSPVAPAVLLPGGQYALNLKAGCDTTDIVPLYNTELTAALFVFKNGETGGVIPVSAITKVGSKLTVTLDTTSPNYPALVGQKIIGSMVLPSALATAGIPGYEAGTVTLTRVV